MAVELATAWVSLVPSTSKLAPAVRGELDKAMPREGQRAGSRLGAALSGAMKKAALGGMVAVGVAVGASLLDGLRSAVNIQTAQKTLAGLYGSADQAAGMMQRLRDISARSPIEYAAYAKGAQQLAYMGLKGDEAAKVLQNVGAAITAAGGGSEQMDRATYAMLQMVNAGKVQLDTLNQLSAAGVPIFSGLAAHFNTNIANVREMVTAGKVGIDDVMSVVQKAEGSTFKQMVAASKTASTSTGNQFKILRDNLATTLGFMFQPGVRAVGGWLQAVNRVVPKIPAAVAAIRPALAAALSSAPVQSIVASLRSLWTSAQSLVGPLTNVGQAMAPLARAAVAAAIAAIVTAFKALAVVGRVVASVLGAVGKFAQQHPTAFRAIAIAVLGAIAAWKIYRLTVAAVRAVQLGMTAATYGQAGATYATGAALRIYNALMLRAKVQTIATTVAQKAAAFASKAWAAAQWLLNAAMTANPVGVVIALVVALVAAIVIAYKRSSTFRAIVQAAFRGIVAVTQWAWQNVLRPIFVALGAALRVVGSVFAWLYRNVVRPQMRAIGIAVRVAWVLLRVIFGLIQIQLKILGAVFRWLYRNAVQPAFRGIILAARALAAVAKWLYRNAIQPALRGIASVAVWLYRSIIRPQFAAISTAARAVGAAATWLYRNAIAPAFRGIQSIVSSVWNRGVHPVLSALSNFIRKTVPNAFRTGVSAIGTAWRKVQEVAKKPVSFVLRTVIKDGIVGGFNKIAGVFGVDKIDFKIPKGFRRGGAVRGPGGKTGDRIPAWLSDDEHVLTAREVAAMGGHAAVERLRAAALHGVRMPFAKGGHASLIAFGKWLRSRGFRVGEHPAFGGVAPVHSSGSWHYRAGAIDANYGPGGQSKTEMNAFDRIIKSGVARKNYGLRSIWRYPGHYNHAHFDLGAGPDLGMGQGGGKGLLGFFGRVAGAIANPFKGLIAKVTDKMKTFARWGGVMTASMKKLLSGAWQWVQDHNPFAGIGESDADTKIGGAKRWSPLVNRVLKELGEPASALRAVLHRINQESGGNPRAVNNWDSNAKRGTPSKGLMQTIGPTFSAYAGKYRRLGIFNPLANIYAGINYARQRYGRGWIRKMTAPGGYDSGGWLDPFQPAINRTSKPEPVLTREQWRAVRAYLPTEGEGSRQQPLVGTVHIEGRPEEARSLMDEFAWKLRTIRRGGVYATA